MSTRKRTSQHADVTDVISDFEKAYESALKDLGKFNLAIFGKTGAGKSTLINAMFSAEVAKTGNGRPVTLKTEYFEHPSGYFGVAARQDNYANARQCSSVEAGQRRAQLRFGAGPNSPSMRQLVSLWATKSPPRLRIFRRRSLAARSLSTP